MIVLNRAIRVDDAAGRITIEPDRRHLEALLRELDLGTAKAAPTPRVKRTPKEQHEAQ